jgi:hypothetical protein
MLRRFPFLRESFLSLKNTGVPFFFATMSNFTPTVEELPVASIQIPSSDVCAMRSKGSSCS